MGSCALSELELAKASNSLKVAEEPVVRDVSGSLSRTGAQQVKPTSGYFHANGGKQTGCLAGPANANFDLYLQRWTGHNWQVAAKSTGASSTESLTFDGKAGFYRYVVVSVKGAGAYTLGADIP